MRGHHPLLAGFSGLLAAITLAYLTASGAAASPGDLDPTFGGDGRVTTDVGRHGGRAQAVAAQDNGKLVVAGWVVTSVDTPSSPAGSAVVLARYRADGKLDRHFGSDGRGWLEMGFGNFHNWANDVAIQPNGKIVVVGGTAPPSFEEEPEADFGIARFRRDGRLDASFGDQGKVVTDFDGRDDDARSVMVQPDGKLVVAGRSFDSSQGWDVAIARYNADGSPDQSFGNGGEVLEDFFADTGVAELISDAGTLQGGKIVVAGDWIQKPSFVDDPAVARFNADGSLDAGFGNGGVATADFGSDRETFWAVTTDQHERLVAAGATGGRVPGLVTNSFALARFTADGALDQDFGRAGQVTTDFAGRHDTAYGLALDGNRIVLAGETFGKRRTRFALARYLDDGSIDFSFGTRGRVATRFARRYAGARDVTVTASGRIVPVGGAGGLFALARYLP